MQIKAISLFIASYLVISTIAAPTTPTPEEAAAAGQAKTGGALPEPVGGVVGTVGGAVKGLPLVGPLAGGALGGALGGVTGQ
jgi:hypothetical protein